MLIPSLLWVYHMTAQGNGFLSPQWLGIVGLLSFYQMFYGAVLYFASFFTNKRHKVVSLAEVCGFVGVSNGIWIVFPMVGMYASVRLILENSYAVFL